MASNCSNFRLQIFFHFAFFGFEAMELEVITTLTSPGQTEDFLTEIRREVALPFYPRQKSQQCSQVWLFIAESAKLQLSLTT